MTGALDDGYTSLLTALLPPPTGADLKAFAREAPPLPAGFADRVTTAVLAQVGESRTPRRVGARSARSAKTHTPRKTPPRGHKEPQMTSFAVQAVDAKGNKVQKKVSATDRDDALAQIKGMGLFPTKVKATKGPDAAVATSGSETKEGKTFTLGGVSLGALTIDTNDIFNDFRVAHRHIRQNTQMPYNPA